MSKGSSIDIYSSFIKRTADIIAAVIICLMLLSWMIPLLALLIKLTSRGPVFFLQDRTGFNNSTFRIIKFRTMLVNNESDQKQATFNDARITKVGHILRKYSIDEIPQILNVLKGDMSIVGPRPHMVSHTIKYSELNFKFVERADRLPGITGLAQVMGFRGEIKNEYMLNNRIRWDLFYNKNCSFKLDCFILLKTLQIVLFGDEKAKRVTEIRHGKEIG